MAAVCLVLVPAGVLVAAFYNRNEDKVNYALVPQHINSPADTKGDDVSMHSQTSAAPRSASKDQDVEQDVSDPEATQHTPDFNKSGLRRRQTAKTWPSRANEGEDGIELLRVAMQNNFDPATASQGTTIVDGSYRTASPGPM